MAAISKKYTIFERQDADMYKLLFSSDDAVALKDKVTSLLNDKGLLYLDTLHINANLNAVTATTVELTLEDGTTI